MTAIDSKTTKQGPKGPAETSTDIEEIGAVLQRILRNCDRSFEILQRMTSNE